MATKSLTQKVTILMPVGPTYNEEWLKEAVDSVKQQTYHVEDIQLVLDGRFSIDISKIIDANSFGAILYNMGWTGQSHFFGDNLDDMDVHIYRIPANVGYTAAYNIGMSIARNDLVMYLASDDKLLPTAVEETVNCYLENNRKDAWYALSYVSSEGVLGDIPNNAAMITKGLWKMVGGFPPAAFVGPDAAILSCLIKHAPDRIIKVKEGTPLYWIREHDQQETKIHTMRFFDEMNSIRDKLTRDFKLRET